MPKSEPVFRRAAVASRQILVDVEVGVALARRDLAADFRGTRLGLLWPLLTPLAYTALFVGLKPMLSGPHEHPDPLTYALKIFIGFSLWQAWFSALRNQMDTLRRNRLLVSRADLRPAALLASGYIACTIRLLFPLAVSVIAILASGDGELLGLIQFLGVALIVPLNGSAIGLILQPFATLYQDIGKTLQSISLALVASAGVFFTFPDSLPVWTGWLLAMNPLGPLVDVARSAALNVDPYFSWAALIWLMLTPIIIFFQLSISKRVLPIVLERLGS
ncbi:hypothetical protein AEMCBJ_15045 [Cupriavidus necator]|uniref:ABC transporter permease n=1 Tax=Cupriavidus necator TaxID=106590 RepID=UPI003F73C313